MMVWLFVVDGNGGVGGALGWNNDVGAFAIRQWWQTRSFYKRLKRDIKKGIFLFSPLYILCCFIYIMIY